MTNLNINCPNMQDIPYNQIPLQKVGDYWGFDTRSVTVQYTETIAVFKMSSEVIKCPTIGAASFGQSPYIAHHLPVRGVVGHNIDRRIKSTFTRSTFPPWRGVLRVDQTLSFFVKGVACKTTVVTPMRENRHNLHLETANVHEYVMLVYTSVR